MGPILLKCCFRNKKYHKHVTRLVELLIVCLQFELSAIEIDGIEVGFIHWVQGHKEYVPFPFTNIVAVIPSVAAVSVTSIIPLRYLRALSQSTICYISY